MSRAPSATSPAEAAAALTGAPAPSVARTVPAPLSRLPGLDRLPPAARPWIFSVEDDAIQVTWHALGPGPLRLRAADTVVEIETDGGPGAVVLDGLPWARRLELRLDGEAVRGLPRRWRHQRFETLAPPPGEQLFRFATISDLHVGEIAFGFRNRMLERPVPDEAHPVRATRAALDALTAWGAELALVKGDLTHSGRTKDWDTIGRLLNRATVPIELLPGNHDQYGAPGEPSPYDALLHLGHDLTRHYESFDVPGLRIVLVDSTADGHRLGHVRQVTEGVLAELRAASTPAFVTMHHYAQRTRIPVFWPPGIDSAEANAFLEKVAAVQPATFISSGHTHRHRRRYVGPLVLTEVGSPKDFPGTWAGYVVHEGGIRQMVRRVATPDLLRWTDYSANAALGVWGLWSPGLRSHRCFSHAWPR